MSAKRTLAVLLVALPVALTGCGGDDPAPAPDPSAAATTPPSTSDTRSTGAPATSAPSVTSAPPAKPAPTDQAEADRALCAVQGPALRGLTGGATGDNRYEALRDAIPELRTRIAAIDPTVRPKLRALAATLQQVYAGWVTALQAHDDGDQPAATRALAAADRSLAAAAAQAAAALPTGASC